jgi:hypothetical protein
MSVSSDKCLRILERLNVKQIQTLLTTLHGATLSGRQFIKARYEEQGRHFSETLEFITDLGWVRTASDELILSEEYGSFAASSASEGYVTEKIIHAMMISNAYASVLAEYLVQFNVVGNEVARRPSHQARLRESAIRNFLIDMTIVLYDNEHDRFVLKQDYVHLYLWAKNVRGPKTKRAFEAMSRQREELGSSAESAVFEYEKLRVGEELAAHVEYISATYPFACYDVKSITTTADSNVPRYIEVKAVSPDSYEFYWSRSELEAAKLLSGQYFLYLLPVSSGMFEFSQLLVIENPYETVYENTDNWLVEDNVILCRRK